MVLRDVDVLLLQALTVEGLLLDVIVVVADDTGGAMLCGEDVVDTVV